MELGEFALNMVVELLGGAIQAGVSYTSLPYFTKRKINRRVEDATAEIVEPLMPFLTNERIPEDKQKRLIQACIEELRPFTDKPELLFQSSLNGQQIFDELYASRPLPQVIIEDGLKDIYTLIFPRIATLLCKIPSAVRDWESTAWAENFRRFDEISSQLRNLFSKVDQLANSSEKDTDDVLFTTRRMLAQKIGLELDLTGLRADNPRAGKFDNFFIHPTVSRTIEGKTKNDPVKRIFVNTPDESFQQFTKKKHAAVIVGSPGSGKSTWSKWLQKTAFSPKWNGIAAKIELRSLSTETLPALHDIVRDVAGKHIAADLTAERIKKWLEDHRIMFILDGFDEIRPSNRDKVLEWIIDLKSAARDCPFVLTSRPLTTNHLNCLGSEWKHWYIEPFDIHRIIDYIQRWYQFTPLLNESERTVDGSNLATQWRADPTIGPLTANPLLLSTLLMVHHLDGSLPSGRSQLYERYVKGMLGLWDDRRKVAATAITLSLEQKKHILRNLALHLFLNEEEQLDEHEVIVWMKNLLEKLKINFSAEEVLSTLLERSGLIIGPGIYSFTHKSIAEYFVAETIFQGDQCDANGQRIDRFLLFRNRTNDRWNTVTFLWAGLAPISDLENFINECISNTNAEKLGAGLIYDQYEKIPLIIRRRSLLKILSQKECNKLLNRESNNYWTTSYPCQSHPIEEGFLKVPTFYLKGLKAHVMFHNLILRAAQDETLIYPDIACFSGKTQKLLWISFASNSKNIKIWKQCLKKPITDTPEREAWLFLVLEHSIHYCIDKKDYTHLYMVLHSYKETCPQFSYFIPIVLISALLYHLTQFNKSNSDAANEFNQILKTLSNYSFEGISEKLLHKTLSWRLEADDFEKEGDLLVAFLEQLDKLAQKEIIERDEEYKNIISYVLKLQKTRESIK